MAISPSSFAPRTREDAERIVRAGCRDIRGAAHFTGLSRTEIWSLIARGLVWSFKRGKKRLVPVSELRRHLALIVAEESGIEE